MSSGVIIGIIVGIVLGIILCGLFIVWLMRKYMVVAHVSKYDFDTTCKRLQQAVKEATGWVHPFAEWNVGEIFPSKGFPLNSKKFIVYFLCKAPYAQKIMNDSPFMAAIMPCGWAVYEKDGKTYIGTMNIPLMAKMFSGVIKEVMSKVAKEEEQMLERILK